MKDTNAMRFWMPMMTICYSLLRCSLPYYPLLRNLHTLSDVYIAPAMSWSLPHSPGRWKMNKTFTLLQYETGA